MAQLKLSWPICISIWPIQRKLSKALIANQTSPTAFQFLCMALAINTVDGGGLSNEVRRELQPKKSKVISYSGKFSKG